MILCNHSVFAADPSSLRQTALLSQLSLGYPRMSCPLSSPKRTFLSAAKILRFRHLGATNYGFRTLSCTVTAYNSGARSRIFERQRRSLVKSYYPLDESYIGCAFVTRVFLYKYPSPIEKTLPLPVSSQYVPNSLTTYTPSPLPHANPFPHPPISRPSLSSYPPIPPPRTPSSRNHNPPPTKPAHSRTDTPTPHKRIGYKFPHPSMTDIPTHTHQHGIQTTKQQPDISRLASYSFFFFFHTFFVEVLNHIREEKTANATI